MQAIVQSGYGTSEVLTLREVKRPAPRDDQVLVRVRASCVHADVWHVMRGWPYIIRVMGNGLFRLPQPIPGTDVAGEVVEVGKNVADFRPGDAVFGKSVTGHEWKNGGAFAEYAAVSAQNLALKPAHLSFEEAATVPTSGAIALENIRDWGLETGKKVLILGAGGGVGSIAVQLAKSYGAEVTVVDRQSKLETLRELGADHAIDFEREDFAGKGQRYDLLFDVVGTRSLADCRRALVRQGTYILIGHDHYGVDGGTLLGSIPRFLKLLFVQPFVTQRLGLRTTTPSEPHLVTLTRLLEQRLLTPRVEQVFPLAEVRAAMRALEEGQSRGRIVLTI